MSGSTTRLQAISAVTNWVPGEEPLNFSDISSSDLFGCNVFSRSVMKSRLPKDVYLQLVRTIENGEVLDRNLADIVASAMKDWAIERGATHYAHVFYPLTGSTAEKHDSFIEPDGNGGAFYEFSGKQLIQGEPDASSFPNGGIRATFEARGYTGWDVTSPAYLLENQNGTTLCIPTVFVSWTGEALDKKTPLLRSMQAMNAQAQRVLKLFGHQAISKVVANAGVEQEYFLIDRNFYFSRPDLLLTGRTLFGARSAKGQEFEDQYFGAIPERVLAFMLEVERECYKLGVPVKTRHNEVAPGQYELAPLYESANIASDHQQLIMLTLKRVAEKYGMSCILHEKPFAGLNGSGKHLNFSVSNSTQGNLFEPGDSPHENAQFLVFCSAMIRAVHRWGHTLRAAVATAGNDHRLGANEAPPSIISIYLGEQLADVFDQIKKGAATSSKKKGTMHVGVDTIPPLPKDAGDRNRTSPFAFTGNKFEFRAVGANQSVAGPLVVLNTILAESMDYIATELEKVTKGDTKKLNSAIQKLIKDIIIEHGAVVFNGDGYSEAWQKEAEKRGLPNLRTCVDAIPGMESKEVVALFAKYKVLSKREMESRVEIYLEQYCKTIKTEANMTAKLAKTHIFPSAIRYQNELSSTCANLSAVGYEFDTDTLDKVTDLVKDLQDSVAELQEIVSAVPGKNSHGDAKYYCEVVIPAMKKVRESADELEDIVADDLWSLPSYMEMLFIK
jgi:glutamine synthetase